MARKKREAAARRLHTVVGAAAMERVVFCGPLGVGKTTAVRTISDVEVANTDVRSATLGQAGQTRSGKRTTTVGIDYGEWRPTETMNVAVYGTPGQVRFDTVRSNTMTFSVRLVLWLLGQNDYALDEAEEWLVYLGATDPTIYERMTVAVTRLCEPGEHPRLEDFRPLLDRFSPAIPLLAADPRERADVERVVATAVRRRDAAQARPAADAVAAEEFSS
jgi:uncharacterized protein